jgi:hypothetical protein
MENAQQNYKFKFLAKGLVKKNKTSNLLGGVFGV